jgi:hypothetical protein
MTQKKRLKKDEVVSRLILSRGALAILEVPMNGQPHNNAGTFGTILNEGQRLSSIA